MNPVHVISLARSTDRREVFANTNHAVPFLFVDGVDGAALPAEAIQHMGLFAEPVPYTPGAIGCALSHLRQWELAIERQTPITIAEDDAIFRADFPQKSAEVMAQLPPDWDIMVWGWNYDSILRVDHVPPMAQTVMAFSQEQLRRSVSTFQASNGPVNLFRLFNCFGSMAYTISPKGAAKFKQACFPLRNFQLKILLINNPIRNRGIDSAMNKVYGELGSYVCFPPLVISKNERQLSTVQLNPVS